MGDPRKTRKKYQTPSHPWIATRIEEEKGLKHSFGTKSKKELYKMDSALKRFKNQAKLLASRIDAQASVEQEQLMNKLAGLGLVSKGASLDDILGLSITDVMNRRLQTILVKRLLARSVKQARQLITHGHVSVAGKVVTSPSFLVRVADESSISFRASSPFINEQHPERFSEAELEAQRKRAQEKAAARSEEAEEEAPPAFVPEDVEGTEKKPKAKAEPVKAEAKTEPTEKAEEEPVEQKSEVTESEEKKSEEKNE